MTARSIIQGELNRQGKSQTQLSEELGFSKQSFYGMLARDTLKARDFLKAIDLLGLTFELRYKETGEVVVERELRRGVIPQKISMVVDKVRYDTSKSDALCHTEMCDGWLMELYRDYTGRYFLVHYTDWQGVKPSISPCEKSHARGFYEVYRDISDPAPEDVFGNAE